MRPKPRKYQTEAKKQVYKELETVDNVLLYLPTGAGKTTVAAEIIADCYERGESVLFVAHMKELIGQARDRLIQYGIFAGTIQGNKNLYRGDSINVASIQTLNTRGFIPVQTILYDEAHHCVKKGRLKQFFEHYKGKAKIIGLSATPKRLDNQPLGDVFNSLIIPEVDSEIVDVRYLINEGWLVQPVYYSTPLKHQINKSDLRQGHELELFKNFNKKVIYNDAVYNYKKHLNNKKAVVFCINIEHSKKTCEEFVSSGISCEHLDGTIDDASRKQILARFKSGVTKVLCNVNLITEGFDLPDIDGILGFRPTDSESLWLQMIGRALRPVWPAGFDANTASPEQRKQAISESFKPNAIVVDLAENCFRLGFAEDRREYTLLVPKNKKHSPIPSVRICDELNGGCGRMWNFKLDGANCPDCGKVYSNGVERNGPIIKTGELAEVKAKKIEIPPHLNKLIRQMTVAELEEFRALFNYRITWVINQFVIKSKDKAIEHLSNNKTDRSIIELENLYLKAYLDKYSALKTERKKAYAKGWSAFIFNKYSRHEI